MEILTMNKNLFAFWKYDTFPYVLGGEISDINEKGLVYVDSYQGWFKPILILPLDEGVRRNIKLNAIAKEYEEESKILLAKGIDKVKTLLVDLALNTYS